MIITMNDMPSSSALTRRQALVGAMSVGVMALAALPSAARAMPTMTSASRVNPQLMARARAALDQHAGRIMNRDRIGLVDFSQPSRDARFSIIDVASGQGMTMLVAHGRGSDPAHSGWLEQFSNDHGSLATSNGAYLTAARYTGVHGESQRLIGLDPGNFNAEARAIVIHPAAYVSDDIIAMQGKLGRSEGCFALRAEDIAIALALLGEGTMIYADRV